MAWMPAEAATMSTMASTAAYFVEVDFFYGDVVNLCFACAEEFKGMDGGLFHGRGEVWRR